MERKIPEIIIFFIPKIVSFLIGGSIGFISGIVGIGGRIFLSPILLLIRVGLGGCCEARPDHLKEMAILT